MASTSFGEINLQDPRRNGQLPKSQLTKKSICQKRQPQTVGHFMFGSTTWKLIISHSIFLPQYPSPLNYRGFPKSVCTSVNNVVCHGIPDDRPLEDGDIINVDVTVYLDGFHGDCSRTFLVGEVDSKGAKLVQVIL
jgi:methionyl aminopeptidase